MAAGQLGKPRGRGLSIQWRAVRFRLTAPARILTRSINISEQKTSGVDFNINLATPELPFIPGSLQQNLRLSYVDSFKQQGLDLAGTFSGGVDGSSAFPKWRGVMTSTYTYDWFDVEFQVNYVDSIRDQGFGTTVPTVNLLNYSGVPSYFTGDLLLRFRPMENFRVSVGVNNVADRDPPYAFVLTRNALAAIHDQIGRYFFASVQQKF